MTFLFSNIRFSALVVLLLASPMTTNAFALDRLYEKSGESIAGEVAATDKKGVQFKKGNKTQTFLSGDVQKILFAGDPSELTKGREFALDGQYDQALDELNKIDFKTIKRDMIKADAAFYIAFCQSKMALSGKGAKDKAAKTMLSFAGTYKDSWHFFDAAKLLGDLALALGNSEKALTYYKALASAQSADTKVESVYLQGLVHLKKGNGKKALAELDKVIGLKASTTQTARIQVLAKAGKAVALSQQGKSDEGLTLVNTLIAELNPSDIEMSARIYNAQGASFEAKGDNEGAVLAYLHTHLMFSTQPDAHAEALIRLIDLWPKIGKPERAAEARAELRERYPGVK